MSTPERTEDETGAVVARLGRLASVRVAAFFDGDVTVEFAAAVPAGSAGVPLAGSAAVPMAGSAAVPLADLVVTPAQGATRAHAVVRLSSSLQQAPDHVLEGLTDTQLTRLLKAGGAPVSLPGPFPVMDVLASMRPGALRVMLATAPAISAVATAGLVRAIPMAAAAGTVAVAGATVLGLVRRATARARDAVYAADAAVVRFSRRPSLLHDTFREVRRSAPRETVAQRLLFAVVGRSEPSLAQRERHAGQQSAQVRAASSAHDGRVPVSRSTTFSSHPEQRVLPRTGTARRLRPGSPLTEVPPPAAGPGWRRASREPGRRSGRFRSS